MKQPISIFLAILGLAMLGSTAWSAEIRFDLYGGVAASEDSTISAALPLASEFTTRGVNFEDRPTVGFRFRVFSEAVPAIGFGQDFYFFSAQSPGIDIDVFAISPMLMLRLPLATEGDFPNGKINPYFGIGPTIAILGGTFDLQPNLSQRISDTTFEIGYQALVGLLINLDDHIGIFGEYKFTNLTPDFRDHSGFCAIACTTSEKAKVGLQSHHFVIGLSIRF